MPFEPLEVVHALERNRSAFEGLLAGVSAHEREWRPEPSKWHLLDVVCHLRDEETEDFRTRLRLTLEDPAATWPPIDPAGWPESRGYADEDYSAALSEFLSRRDESVEWLRSLGEVDWARAHVHPKVGPVRARLILDNWLAHDYLHLRQIIRIRYEYVAEHTREKLDYAGDW